MDKRLIIFLSSFLLFMEFLVTQTHYFPELKTKVRDYKQTSDEDIFVIATGDVMLGRSVNYKMQNSKDYTFPFQKVEDVFKSADLVYVNLESPLYDPCQVSNEGIIFCAPTEAVSGLKDAGVDVVNLANNHSRNYGSDGYESTINALKKESILYSDSENLAEVVVGNTKFGFLGFDLVSKKIKDEDIPSRISDVNNKVDVLVVSFHWGQEYSKDPSDYQKKVARLAIDAGADLVIGHHPHVVQSIEVYKDKVIAYSLGNFVFDQLWTEETRKGIAAKFTFKKTKMVSYEILPVYINNYYQPEVTLDSEKKIFSLR